MQQWCARRLRESWWESSGNVRVRVSDSGARNPDNNATLAPKSRRPPLLVPFKQASVIRKSNVSRVVVKEGLDGVRWLLLLVLLAMGSEEEGSKGSVGRQRRRAGEAPGPGRWEIGANRETLSVSFSTNHQAALSEAPTTICRKRMVRPNGETGSMGSTGSSSHALGSRQKAEATVNFCCTSPGDRSLRLTQRSPQLADCAVYCRYQCARAAVEARHPRPACPSPLGTCPLIHQHAALYFQTRKPPIAHTYRLVSGRPSQVCVQAVPCAWRPVISLLRLTADGSR